MVAQKPYISILLTSKRTSTNRREQSCVALLYSSMFAVEARIHSETLAGLSEMERTPAAYAFQRYHKLGVPSEAAGEMAKTATKRAKNICVNLQSQHQELWSSINVDFHRCGITQMWISTNVNFHKCAIAQLLSSGKVNSHKCGLTQLSSSTNVDLRKCGVAQMSTSTVVDFHKCGITHCRVTLRTRVTCLGTDASSTTRPFKTPKARPRKGVESMPTSWRRRQRMTLRLRNLRRWVLQGRQLRW